MPTTLIRPAQQQDLPALLAIYNHEILNGVATFDLQPKSLAERQSWFDEHNKN
ncbi:GNAT family acetyltransferase, partial [Gallibacterium anatis]